MAKKPANKRCTGDQTPVLYTMLPGVSARDYWAALDVSTRERIVLAAYWRQQPSNFEFDLTDAMRVASIDDFAFLPNVLKAHIYDSPEFRGYTADHPQGPKVPRVSDSEVQ